MFEFKIALRYMRSRDKGAFVSLISGFSFAGIAIGVATLIIVMSVMNGFRDKLIGYLISVSGHISIVSQEGYNMSYDAIAQAIRPIQGISSSIPSHNEEALIMSDSKISGIYLIGIEENFLKHKKIVADAIIDGSIDGFNGVILGSELARTLDVEVGDTITVASPDVFVSLMGVAPIAQEYTVSAIFEIGVRDYDNAVAYLNLTDMNTLFDSTPETINNIEISAKNLGDVDKIAAQIKLALGRSLSVKTWKDANLHFVNAIRVERNVMFMILTLIMIVAAFNIISSLAMLTQDKKMHIAVLKTFGASNLSIAMIFVVCGLIIGVTGALSGAALGSLIAYNLESIKNLLEQHVRIALLSPVVSFFSELPSKPQTSDIAIILAMSLSLSFFAAMLPALRAAKRSPAELLRGM